MRALYEYMRLPMPTLHSFEWVLDCTALHLREQESGTAFNMVLTAVELGTVGSAHPSRSPDREGSPEVAAWRPGGGYRGDTVAHLDATQGHAARTAGDSCGGGDQVKAMAQAMERAPRVRGVASSATCSASESVALPTLPKPLSIIVRTTSKLSCSGIGGRCSLSP